MIFFLTTRPLWLSALLLVVLPVLVAMSGPVLVRRFVALDRLKTNNEVAGFKFATVGVLYAVLLAFAVIVVWEKFNDADKSVAQEAGAAATIYRLAEGIGGEPGAALSTAMTSYLNAAINEEWPAMERGRASLAVTRALDGVYDAVLTYRPSDARGAALLTEVLYQLDQVTQARRGRLVLASGIVPGVIWCVLFGGAALTVAFTFFFGTQNIRAQMVMAGALCAMIFSGLLVIVAIDHPFAGTVKVGPGALSAILEEAGAKAL